MTKKPNPGQFKPGKSGNPAGKPKGTRNKATLAAEKLLDGELNKLTRKAIALAHSGDATALKIVFDRALPPRKDRPVRLKLPKLKDAGDVMKALSIIAEQTALGELTPGEAEHMAKVIESFVTASHVAALEEKIKELEAAK